MFSQVFVHGKGVWDTSCVGPIWTGPVQGRRGRWRGEVSGLDTSRQGPVWAGLDLVRLGRGGIVQPTDSMLSRKQVLQW